MKLIREEIEKVEVLTEESNGKKNLFIKGIFLQAEQVNRNGRVYRMPVMEREVNRYNEQYVQKGRALGELGNKKAVDHVIRMLKDEWVNVRIYAVTSLGKLDDTQAVPALIEVLKDESENELVRAGAAAALGVLRDQRALLPLRELIMRAEELGELEDTALKAFKKIMAANWQNVPGAINKKNIINK